MLYLPSTSAVDGIVCDYVILAHCVCFHQYNFVLKCCFYFQNGVLVKVTEACPPLNCSEKDHVLPENQCCSVCRGKPAWEEWELLVQEGDTLKGTIPF